MACGAVAAVAVGAGSPGCYSAGSGTAPSTTNFYYPVGLVVSPDGRALYAVNSDFDLQYSGGTAQSFDLGQIRRDVLKTIANPSDPSLPFVYPGQMNVDAGACTSSTPPLYTPNGTGSRLQVGEVCSPPMQPVAYLKDSVVLGAFATDLLLSHGTRLFAPVRGDASVTWWDVDTAGADPFTLNCGVRVDDRCDDAHHAGTNSFEPNNTRNLTLPGEPFGIAESRDHTALAVTSQTQAVASLLSTGFDGVSFSTTPALQYILGNVPNGGIGMAAVPHPFENAQGQTVCPPGVVCPNPAFLLTNDTKPEMDLLRYYPDMGDPGTGSSFSRPFLVEENTFQLTLNMMGVDQRGLAIDDTPRRACKAAVSPTDPNATALLNQCELTPDRVFASSRSPPSLLLGQMGATQENGSFDPDALSFFGSVPLSLGPSKAFLAPVIDAAGNYALRVFIVCFDDDAVFVYDPDTQTVENILPVGEGPYALAFDPFDWDDVAAKRPAPLPDATGLRPYRFAYLASFTESYVQILDLDGSRADKTTYENVVFTLGTPTLPLGTEGQQ